MYTRAFLFLAGMIVVPFLAFAQDFTQYINFNRAMLTVGGGLDYQSHRVLPYMGQGQAALPVLGGNENRKYLSLHVEPTAYGQSFDRSEYAISSAVFKDKMYYIGFNFFIPTEINLSENAPDGAKGTWSTIITQCPQPDYSNTGGVSPPLSIQIRDGKLGLVTISDKRDDRWINHLDNISLPIQKGVWNQLILRFRLGDQGNLKLWFNGRVINVRDPYVPIGYLMSTDNCNLKFGIYRGASTNAFGIRFNNVVFASQYDDVKKRLTE